VGVSHGLHDVHRNNWGHGWYGGGYNECDSYLA
jgi:hypothetical protein